MTVRSALRFLRERGPWRVVSLANGTLLVKPSSKDHRLWGVLTRMGLASALSVVINATAKEQP
jgi:hypothetical protein